MYTESFLASNQAPHIIIYIFFGVGSAPGLMVRVFCGALLWQSFASPQNASLSEGSSCSGLSVSLSCGPSVLRLSQSLVHTTSMAVNLWREREEGKKWEGSTSLAAADLLMGHYVLCNDTLDDIHFGQVATGEDLLLPSNSCIGYSWRNHKTNLQVIVTN